MCLKPTIIDFESFIAIHAHCGRNLIRINLRLEIVCIESNDGRVDLIFPIFHVMLKLINCLYRMIKPFEMRIGGAGTGNRYQITAAKVIINSGM